MEISVLLTLVTSLLVYTGLLFGGWAWMLRNQTKQIKAEITVIKAEITPIKEALDNHITDTNKKIDRLTDRIDKQGEQFNRLYELLLRDKQNQSSK